MIIHFRIQDVEELWGAIDARHRRGAGFQGLRDRILLANALARTSGSGRL